MKTIQAKNFLKFSTKLNFTKFNFKPFSTEKTETFHTSQSDQLGKKLIVVDEMDKAISTQSKLEGKKQTKIYLKFNSQIRTQSFFCIFIQQPKRTSFT